MVDRCTNPENKQYPDYGARGITVCERWMDFEAYYADLGDLPEGMSLDRLDNDRGYEPGNVRWATRLEQNRNRRRPYRDKTHCPGGHPYSGGNLYVHNGRRHCKECRRRQLRESRARRAASGIVKLGA